MKRLPALCFLFVLLLLAVSGLWAQPESLILATGFNSPRTEFSPDGGTLAVFEDASYAVAMEFEPAETNTAILLYDAETGEKASMLEGATDFTASLLFSQDGARMYGLLVNGQLLTWDLASGDLLKTVRTPMIAARTPLFWHPATGEMVAAIPNYSYTSYVSVDPESGALTLLTMHPDFATYGELTAFQDERGVRILNDIVVVPFAHSEATAHLPLVGDEVWTVNAQGQVALLSLGSGEAQVLVEGVERPMLNIRDLTATEGGLVAFADTVEDTLFVLDLVQETTTEFPIEHDSATLSPDGTQFAQYNEDGTALLLTPLEDGAIATLALPAELETLRPLMRLRFSPDGAMLAVAGLVDASEEGVILLYRLEG